MNAGIVRHCPGLAWPGLRQLVELGMVRTAPDARELAALIGVPADALTATVAGVVQMA